MTTTPFDLERFVTAQEPIFATALDELEAGRKRNHWMWFVFPQLFGLGISQTSALYGISSIDEARAYLAHPVLGPRLKQCTEAVIKIEGRTLKEIFGSPDDEKFCSSMTLFALAVGDDDNIYRQALDRWCDGRMDERTVEMLGVA